jgi:serine protease AprX
MKRWLTSAMCVAVLAACGDLGNTEQVTAPEGMQRLVVAGVHVDPLLDGVLAATAPNQRVQVILTFDRARTRGDVLGAAVQRAGAGVLTFRHLPMVAALATPAEVRVLATLPGVRGVWAARNERLLNLEGVTSIRANLAHNAGFTGKGVGIAILDSGIDGTHPDLAFGSKVVQNVEIGVNTNDLFTFPVADPVTGLRLPKPASTGASVWVEDVQNTDDNGHGSHVAGSAAGTGAGSDGRYAGVAPGAHLVGVSIGVGGSLPNVMILAGYDYVLDVHREYNIQVINNSWGSSGEFDPEEPINMATKEAYDAGITVVFAAGNEGPGENTLNPRSVAPWVIGVGAACKLGFDPTHSAENCEDEGGRAPLLGYFSSRGIPGDPLYHPDVVAPGVRIVSTRNPVGAQVWGTAILDDAQTCVIPVQHFARYTCISGTSMASPFVAGVVALMEEASGGRMTPDEAAAALTATARPLAGYGVWEVGAGYVDAYAAVKLVHGGRTELP